MSIEAFRPNSGATVSIDVAATPSSAVKIYEQRGPIPVRIMNSGTAVVWIAYGDSSVSAALTDIPIGPGVTEILKLSNLGSGPLCVSAIAVGSTGKIYFTPGTGI